MFDERDKLLRRCLDDLNWLITEAKWRFDTTKEGCNLTDEGPYSVKLERAIKDRDDVEEYFKKGSNEN